jgi:hypothetical protein
VCTQLFFLVCTCGGIKAGWQRATADTPQLWGCGLWHAALDVPFCQLMSSLLVLVVLFSTACKASSALQVAVLAMHLLNASHWI